VAYKYERGEHRKKHCWNNDYADFVERDGHLLGKCPNSITDEIAATLLRSAIAEPEPFAVPGRTPRPKRLYGVHRGVIYEAVPTQPGKSYHGYPWRGREGRGPLATEVVTQLRAMAAAEGYLDQFESWLDEHS
jgi:hypothetical protein